MLTTLQNKATTVTATKATAIDEKLIVEALRLTRPGSIFAPDQEKLVAKAAAMLAEVATTRSLTLPEARVIAVADRLRIIWPERAELSIPQALADRLAAAEKEHEPFVVARDNAQRAWYDASLRYRKSLKSRDEEEVARLERDWKDAEIAAKATGRRVVQAERAIVAHQSRERSRQQGIR